MKAFLAYGLIGTVELLIIFGIIHLVMSRRKPGKNAWLVPVLSLLCGFGYAFNIFIVEGEGSNSFSGPLSDGLPLYLFVFSFFCIVFGGGFIGLKSYLDRRL